MAATGEVRRRRNAAPAQRGGRPSLAQAARLADRILDAAERQFFKQGYGATTIEAVARSARISKRTFYDRFDDKAALFAAVLHRIIERLKPPAEIPLLAGRDAAERLGRLAMLIVEAGVKPEALALHRLIVGESARFPKLAAAVSEEGATQQAIELILEVLRREVAAGELAVPDPALAAEQFLQMVIGVPQRRALGFGRPFSAEERASWCRSVVRLFLDGYRTRGTARAASRPESAKPVRDLAGADRR